MKHLALILIFSFCSISSAIATESQFSWMCKSGSGQWSLNGVDIDKERSISGNIDFRQRNMGTQWASSASINFREKMNGKNFGGLKFYFSEHKDEFPTVSVIGFASKSGKILGRLEIKSPIPFSISIVDNGTVTATIAGETFFAEGRPMETAIAQLSCSSANVEFSELNRPIIDY